MTRARGQPATALYRAREGEKVTALYDGEMRSGKIRRDRGDGSYDIAYDHGPVEVGVKAGFIKSLESSDRGEFGSRARAQPAAPRAQAKGALEPVSVRGQPRGRLYPSRIEPSPESMANGAVKWCLYAGALAAMSFGLHLAGENSFVLSQVPLSAANWDALAKIYPGVAVVGTLFNYGMYLDKNGGGAGVAEAMGGSLSEDPILNQIVSNTFEKSGLGSEPPRVYVVPAAEPNAFAAGTGASVVAVTSGLVDLLTADEVQAVVAHEVGHVRNQDMGRSLQSAAMLGGLGAIMTVGDLLTRFNRPVYYDDDDSDSGASLFAIGTALYLTGLLSYAFGFLVRAGNSRAREFEADAFAKSIGAGDALASALRKLEDFSERNTVVRENGVGLGIARGAFASSYIDNPPSRESPFLNLFGLLRSHPTTDERIQRLLDPDL